jgi:hypothetical protein
MAGGLLNLVSGGTQNAIMYGNPQKTYWTSAYKQITNFGLQNFRLEYEGLRQIQSTSDTIYAFKVKRYAELLTDTFFSFQLPDIYSPIYVDKNGVNQPYEFKWIKNIGAMMIRNIRFTIGGALIQQMSGYELIALANRDLTSTQKIKWNEMIGNTPDMYDPANAYGRNGNYPNATYHDVSPPTGAEPSIRGKTIRVPLPIWWGLNAQQAFPLVCLQYNELQIEITVRPIRELFQIRDITNITGSPNNIISPNMVIQEHQFNNFLYSPPPPTVDLPKSTSWNEGCHLSCTYCFLSEEEAVVFASKPQTYLIRELYQTWFHSIAITDKLWLKNSTNLVLDWMIFFQRSDVSDRNEWSNFTNWPYDSLPITIVDTGNVDYNGSPIYETGVFSYENQKDIPLTLGITFDGTVREEERVSDIFKYEQQYLKSLGGGYTTLDGMYCYNFCLHTDPFSLQPSGAVNLSKYSKIEIECSTITPSLNPDSTFNIICDPLSGQPVAINKSIAKLYNYTFNVLVIEERYNLLTFIGGNASLMNAR